MLLALLFATLLLLYIILSKLLLPIIRIKLFERRHRSRILVVTDDFWSERYLSLVHLYYWRYLVDIDNDEKFQRWFADVIDGEVDRIDLIIHTYGGSMVSSDIIIKNLLDYTGTINVYIPHHAFSAGTRLMLLGDNIYMNSYALASPIDPQVLLSDSTIPMYFSVKSILNLVEQKGIHKVRDSTALQYIEHKKLYDDNLRLLNIILRAKYPDRRVSRKIIQKLGYGDISHHIPHNPDELKAIGIPIILDVPTDVMTIYEGLMSL